MLNGVINLLSGEFKQEPNKPLCIVYRIVCNSKFTSSLRTKIKNKERKTAGELNYLYLSCPRRQIYITVYFLFNIMPPHGTIPAAEEIKFKYF